MAAVFRGAETLPPRPPLWLTIFRWIGALLTRFFHLLGGHPVASAVVRVAIFLALAVVLLRVFLPGLVVRRTARTVAGHRAPHDDWWELATRLAGERRFVDAAHALYVALLSSAAARGLLAIDESKTTGDYLRELRRAQNGPPSRRLSAAELAGWRDFVREYETVVYRLGDCDETCYGTLRGLATTALAGASRS